MAHLLCLSCNADQGLHRLHWESATQRLLCSAPPQRTGALRTDDRSTKRTTTQAAKVSRCSTVRPAAWQCWDIIPLTVGNTSSCQLVAAAPLVDVNILHPHVCLVTRPRSVHSVYSLGMHGLQDVLVHPCMCHLHVHGQSMCSCTPTSTSSARVLGVDQYRVADTTDTGEAMDASKCIGRCSGHEHEQGICIICSCSCMFTFTFLNRVHVHGPIVHVYGPTTHVHGPVQCSVPGPAGCHPPRPAQHWPHQSPQHVWGVVTLPWCRPHG